MDEISQRNEEIVIENEVKESRMVMLPVPKEIVVMMLGAVGAGKTTLHKLLKGYTNGGKMSFSSDTKNIQEDSITYKDYFIKFFDVEGAVGNPKVDVFLLRRVINKINEESNFVHRILWVMTPDRLQVAQRDFLQMIINGVSEEALSIVHVIITHADDLVVKEDFRREVAHHLRFLGDTEEAVLRRVTFMDLVVPETFREGSAARAEIEERWCEYQKKLLSIITNEGIQRVKLDIFFRYSFPVRLIRVFWLDILFLLISCAAVVYLCQYLRYFELNRATSDLLQQCMIENRELHSIIEEMRKQSINTVQKSVESKVQSTDRISLLAKSIFSLTTWMLK